LGTRHGHADIAPLHSHPSPTASSLNDAAGSTGDLIGAASTRSSYGVDGTGMTVAVIDTGVNYQNEALGGAFGPGHKVVAGYDFTQNDGDPLATASQHGTAVAGLIASSDPNHPGVAPGADVAALRVFGSANQGNFDKVAAALQWVIDNHSKYDITAVNLSMSDGNNYAQNWFSQDGGIGQQITGLIGRLDALNIPVVAATGNSFNGQQGTGFPSIIPDTISVTSTDSAGDQLSSNAQRLGSATGGDSATDLAAPGEGLLAPVQGNQFATVDGTSFATAEVTGAVVLLQQIYQARFGQLPTVAQVDSWLKKGADPVSDPVTNLTIGRLDIPKAASFIPNPQAQVLTPPPSAPPPAPSGSPSAPDTPAASTPDPNANTGGTPVTTTSGDSPGSTPTPIATPTPSQPQAQPQPPATTTDPGSSSSGGAGQPAAPSESSQDKAATILASALKSLSGWVGGSEGFKVWSNQGSGQKTLGASHPTGQIKTLVTVPHHPRLTLGAGANPGHSPFVRGWRRR
jgi:type VI secretion system secreted protein VgrG